MKRILTSLAIGGLLTSCYFREVELKYPPVPHRIVLNASVSPGQDVSAFVSKTWFMLDSVPDSQLEGVAVAVYVDGTYNGLMECIDSPADSLRPKGQYRLAGCRLQAGSRLTLTASAPGYETVSADVLVPAFHPIGSADTASFVSTNPYYKGGEGLRFVVGMQKAPSGGHAYRLLVEQQTEYERNGQRITLSTFGKSTYEYNIDSYLTIDYEDPLFRINSVPSGTGLNYSNGLFTDQLLNEGETYPLRLALPMYTKSYRSDTLTSVVTYKVHLMAISDSYFQYYRALENMGVWVGLGGSGWSDIGGREETYTNVYRGLGVVTAYQQDTRAFEMPFDTLPPLWDPWNGYTGNPYGSASPR